MKHIGVVILSLVQVISFTSKHDIVLAQETFEDFSIVVDDQGIEMALVPNGTLQMGIGIESAIDICLELVTERFASQRCSESNFIEFQVVESPQDMEVGAFYIDLYEVSLSSYLDCVDTGICEDNFLSQELEAISSGDEIPLDTPVRGASYYDAAIYCAWREARLPSEAEWEYAASGVDNNVFPWGDEFDGTFTNFCDSNCPLSTVSNNEWNDLHVEVASVDTYERGRSWIGAFNLAGNVAEWTSTRIVDADGFDTEDRVVKGGSYLSFGYETATWSRQILTSSTHLDEIGFRCAKNRVNDPK